MKKKIMISFLVMFFCIFLYFFVGSNYSKAYTFSDNYIGDVNYDGEINVLDLLELKKYVLKMDSDINEKNADINKDEMVDMIDLVALKKYILRINNDEYGFAMKANEIYRKVSADQIPYEYQTSHDPRSYLTDIPDEDKDPNLDYTTIDCSTFVGAALYEYDKDKYKRFDHQFITLDWYNNVETWAKEYGWEVKYLNETTSIDELHIGDIILLNNGNNIFHIQIYVSPVDSTNSRSDAYVLDCGGHEHWVNISNNYEDAGNQEFWKNEGVKLIRINPTKDEEEIEINEETQNFIKTAKNVYQNVSEHQLTANANEPHDIKSYTTDNPSLTIDSSAYISAVLYAYDNTKYSRFAVQQTTYDVYNNAEQWAQEYGWKVLYTDSNTTVDDLQLGDILVSNGYGRNHMQIFMAPINANNSRSDAYVLNCGTPYMWLKSDDYKDCGSKDFWKSEGVKIIRINP